MKMMKTFSLLAITMVALFTASSFVRGADAKKAKPYPLVTCVVSDEKIGADPGMKPYVFTHEGREVKLCCKSCLKDFKKDTAKYMAKIEAAEKKAK
jgi:hypothetical protein